MALRDPISGFWAQIEEARGNDSLTLPFPGGSAVRRGPISKKKKEKSDKKDLSFSSNNNCEERTFCCTVQDSRRNDINHLALR
jgi:hypothetical protein